MINKELSIDELVSLKVKEELEKYQRVGKRLSDGWLNLRKEIDEFIRNNMKKRTGMSFATCQNSIYSPIKIILGINRIDEMTDDQAEVARDIFYYIKNMVELHNQKGVKYLGNH